MHLKKDLLLLHGALGSCSQFKSLIEKLAENYNLFTFDFTGHGKCSTDEGEFSIQKLAEQLSEYIDDHGLNGCDVFGYSMGGYVALYAASKDQQLFGKILTLGTKFDWNPESSAKEASMLNAEKILAKVPTYAASLESLHGDHWKDVLSRTASMMQDLGKHPLLTTAVFEAIKNPVMVCVGDSDKMVSLEESRSAAGSIKDSGFTVLPFTSHPIDQISDDLLAMVIDYYISIR